jgi:hypothetical protein
LATFCALIGAFWRELAVLQADGFARLRQRIHAPANFSAMRRALFGAAVMDSLVY